MTDVDHRLALREAFKGLVGAGGGGFYTNEQAGQSQNHSRGNRLVQFPGLSITATELGSAALPWVRAMRRDWVSNMRCQEVLWRGTQCCCPQAW